MKRLALATLLVSVLVGPAVLAATSSRAAVPGVDVRLARVPDRIGKPVTVDAQGRFRLEGVKKGTWTLTLTLADDYLEKWIAAELKKLEWKRGPAPVKKTDSNVAAQAPEGKFTEGGSREYRVLATDAEGREHHLEFEMVVTVENVIGDGGATGAYVKHMRWHQLTGGNSFKFHAGKDANGVITGTVERVLTID